MKLKIYQNFFYSSLRGGFTIIELLVVIAIISLLSSIVLASLSSARDKAKDAATIQKMLSIRTAAEIYLQDRGSYLPSFTTPAGDGAEGCPSPEDLHGSGSMFHPDGPSVAKSIYDTIQHIESKYGWGAACASKQSSYAVYTTLFEVNPTGLNPETYFCVDSRGTAKKLYLDTGLDQQPLKFIGFGPSGSIQCN